MRTKCLQYKRWISIFLLACLACSGMVQAAAEEAYEYGVTVVVDGQEVSFPDQQPLLYQGRTMIPVRGVMEALGAQVQYLPASDGVFISLGDTEIEFIIHSNLVTVSTYDGDLGTVTEKEIELDVPTISLADRTLVPLRFLSEALGYQVDWQEAGRIVSIVTTDTEPPGAGPSASPSASPAAELLSIQDNNRVSFGSRHAAAIKADGSVWVWGENENGQLGLSAPEEIETPVRTGSFHNAVAVACGRGATLVLTADGSVYIAGTLDAGDAFEADWRLVEGLPAVQAVEAGSRFAVAVDTQGGVWTWGRNDKGQLGRGVVGTEDEQPALVDVLPRVQEIAASGGYVLALTEDGDVYSWGENSEGQLGRRPNASYDITPAKVQSLNQITQIAAGPSLATAVRSIGSVYAWGTIYLGQQGAEDKENIADSEGYYQYPEPTRVWYMYRNPDTDQKETRYFVDAESLACGDYQAAAIKDGHLYAWGDSPIVRARTDSQTERFYAQEYSETWQIKAVYGYQGTTLYALDQADMLWQVTEKGRTEFMQL